MDSEDKLLLSHTLVMGEDVYGSDATSISNISRIGCSNNYLSGGDGLISLGNEYNKHLSSVAINNYNLLFGLSPVPFQFSFYNFYYPVNRLYAFIYEISKICNSKCNCSCTCKCDPKCTGDTICLCLCECNAEKGSGCCICICKHKDNCKCLCICVCNKGGESCCCNTGTPHRCNKCIVKVNINSLLIQTWKISGYLNCIKCYISRIENKCCICSCCQVTTCNQTCCTSCGPCTSPGVGRCCCCSCCPSGCSPGSCQSYCCCKDGEVNYLEIISSMHWIESLFNQISNEIHKLRKLKDILFLISLIATKCEKCNFKDKIKGIIHYISRAIILFDKFGSRIKDIRTFVEYKFNYNKSKDIISSLRKSIQPLSKQLEMINNYLVYSTRNNTSVVQPNNLLIDVYSEYSIFQCFLAMYILLQSSSKISTTIYNIIWSDMCQCQESNNKNNNCLKISDYEKYLIPWCNTSIENLKKLTVNSDGNHLCLCLVIKYILYPNLIKSMYYLRHVYFDSLSIQTRDFIQNNYNVKEVNQFTKLLYLIILLLDKITLWMKTKYYYGWLVYTTGVYIRCFCKNYEDPYYPYLISIILYLSSLMENIWSMDNLSIVSAIECVSSLLAEYQSIHVYTNYGSGESIRDVTGLGLSKLKSFSMTSSKYIEKILITTTPKNGNCNGGSSILLLSHITKSQGMIINNGLKSFFKSVLSSLSILIATPLFALVYSNISGLSFYIIANDQKIGLLSTSIRRSMMSIAYKYIKCSKEQCKEKCCVTSNKECKICTGAKIIYLNLSITMKKITVILSNVSGDMLLNYLKESVNISRDFITNLCVGFGEVYTIMLKNLLTNNDMALRSYGNIGNIGITNVETRNWGYDTKYEYDVTNDRGFRRGDGYPNLIDSGYTFSHLSLFLKNYPYMCIIPIYNP